MGLLDSLFNQSTYSGQTGGLLDLLRTSQMQQDQYQPSAGFPGQASPLAIGGYQMPRIGDQAQYTPPAQDPAALPSNAQPTQGQMPASQESPGGLGAGLNGFINNLHTGPLGALIGGIGSAAGYQSPEQKQANQTAQFLVTKGLDPQAAKAIVSDPALLRSVLPQVLGMGGQTDDIKEYQYAKRENPSLTFEKFMAGKRATTGEYGLNYVYGVDKDGKTVAFAPGKSGEPKQIKLPEGVEFARGIEKIDTGTEVVIRDKQTGAVLGIQKKDIQGKEAAEERGKQQGQAQAKIPAALIDAEETTKKIDDLLKNEGLDSIVGSVDQYRPSWALGESGRKALSQLEQLQGGAFLQAFNTLKGGGAITEIEGQKAERAIARMQRYQSEKDFREALMDFRDAVKTGVRKLQAAANSGVAPAAPPVSTGLPAGWSVKVN